MGKALYVGDNRADQLYKVEPADFLDAKIAPKITRVFADIVAARIRLRDNPDGGLSDDLVATLTQMRKIAATNEVLVTLLPNGS